MIACLRKCWRGCLWWGRCRLCGRSWLGAHCFGGEERVVDDEAPRSVGLASGDFCRGAFGGEVFTVGCADVRKPGAGEKSDVVGGDDFTCGGIDVLCHGDEVCKEV